VTGVICRVLPGTVTFAVGWHAVSLRDDKDPTTTTREAPGPMGTGDGGADGRLRLLVVTDDRVITHWLPPTGQVTIGRGAECEIRIDSSAVSRRHASISVGPPLEIEDLGSSNGTFVGDERLPPNVRRRMASGDGFIVGTTLVVAQLAAAPEESRRLWPHGYFEGRLEEECARAQRTGSTFSILRLRCSGEAVAEEVEEALSAMLRLYDVVGCYGANEYEVLLSNAEAEIASSVAARVQAHLSDQGIEVAVRTATYPKDGRDAFTLTSHAAPDTRRLPPRATEAPTPPAPEGKNAAPVAFTGDIDRVIERVAATTITVLILGETGVGKEVMAERIHRLSPRRDEKLLRLNCAALSETLLESELFGHEKGAFTGAVQAKAGLLETAEGGTIFLDEIGELPMTTQVKLLRVIEERKVMRVGGLTAKPIDVRFLAATNRNLDAEMARGAFRQDLYFRLNGFALVIPPLRERMDEIAGLAERFAREAGEKFGRDRPPAISGEAMDLLMRYRWPGNIRELRNVVERAVVLCGEGSIVRDYLPVEKMTVALSMRRAPRGQLPESAPGTEPGDDRDTPVPPSSPVPPPAAEDAAPARPLSVVEEARQQAEVVERHRIADALAETGGNQTRAAKLLGISRRTLVNRLSRYGISRPRKANRTE